MKKIITLLIISILFIGCKEASSKCDAFLKNRIGKRANDVIKEIDISNNSCVKLDFASHRIDTISLSSIIERVRHVRLETIPESILSNIGEVVCVDTLIYVMDGRGIVKCFNDKGKYLHTVFNVGEGPEDVVRPYDFDADKKGVYVLDGARVRMLTFDHGGKFVSAKYIPYRVTKFKKISEERWILRLTPFNSHFKSIDGYSIIVTDADFSPISKFKKNEETSKITRTPYFDSKYFAPIIDNKIYDIENSEDSVKCSYILDFGKYLPPANQEKIDVGSLYKANKLFTYSSPLSGGDFLLQYFFAKEEPCTLILNTKTNKYIFVNKFINNLDMLSFNPESMKGYKKETGEFIVQSSTLKAAEIDETQLVEIKNYLSPQSYNVIIDTSTSDTEPNGVLTFFKLKKDIDFNSFLHR